MAAGADDDFRSRFALAPGAPQFEIWFCVIADPRARRALWLRHTLLRRDRGAALAVTWATHFDAAAPARHAVGARTHALSECDLAALPYRFADQRLEPAHWTGAAPTDRGPLRWDLRFEAPFPPHGYVPRWLMHAGIAQTKSVVVAPFARVCGNYRLGDEAFALDDAPAVANHLWGTRRVERLVWIFVPAFDDEGADCALEMVWVKPSRFVPAFTLVSLREGVALRHGDSILRALRGRAAIDFPRVRLEGALGAARVSLAAALDAGQVTRYVYRDPDGTPRYIEHSDVGSVECALREPDGRTRVLRCARGAAVEFHGMAQWSARAYLDPYGAGASDAAAAQLR